MSADRWGWVDEVELPRNLAELRDGIAPPPADAGMARARRLEQMQREITECVAFVEDLDRYATHASQAQLVGRTVGPHMARYIAGLRKRTAAHARRLQDDLRKLNAAG